MKRIVPFVAIALSACSQGDTPTGPSDEQIAKISLRRLTTEPEVRYVQKAINDRRDPNDLGYVICGQWDNEGTWEAFMVNSETRRIITPSDPDDRSALTTLKVIWTICGKTEELEANAAQR